MKYILMDQRRGDCFTEEFDTAKEAIAKAEYEWDHMTEREKKQCARFCVLESANPDEEAEDHFDGNPVKSWIW